MTVSFDPELARTLRLPGETLRMLLLGTYLSFEWEVPAVPAIVLVLTGFFALTFALTSLWHRLLSRA